MREKENFSDLSIKKDIEPNIKNQLSFDLSVNSKKSYVGTSLKLENDKKYKNA